jgi:hypothetical protein
MRGYLKLFHDQVNQAGSGCDFEFLAAQKSGVKTP